MRPSLRLLPLALASCGLLAALSPRPATACGDLLIVYDRSGSMAECKIDGEPKEVIAKKAVRSMIARFPTTPMGLFVFPDTLDSCGGLFGLGGDNCKVGKLVMDIAPDGAPKVASWLDGMPRSCGGTPTGNTMQIVKDYAGWTEGMEHYVLLITDGQPTCDDGDDGAMPPKTCNGGGSVECKNPTKVFDAIKALFDRTSSVHTFVVGFEGSGTGSGCSGLLGGGSTSPFNPDTLNRMADLGGEPAAGATHYYSATNEATLAEALDKILGKIAGGTVGGCVRGGGGGGSPGGGADAGGAGSGGSGGGGGSGGPGSGGSDGTGQDGGQAGNGGHGSLHGNPAGCGCRTPVPGGAGAAPLLVIGAGAALRAGGRRRRRDRLDGRGSVR